MPASEGAPPGIQVAGLRKVYDGPRGEPVVAVDDVSFEVAPGATLALIGTSGCGKTTVLKCLNRLVEPTDGRVEIGGAPITGRDPNALRRSMGYVMQSAGLFPHLTVGQNVGLMCELEGWAADRREARVRELLEHVSLEPAAFVGRFPHELSGGQRQRVGIARALALEPGVVLMDEPFGALDPITRRELHEELRRLRAQQPRTIVMVTHDLAEAFDLADRVALMDRGRIVQLGSRADLVNRPASDFVERFVADHGGAATDV